MVYGYCNKQGVIFDRTRSIIVVPQIDEVFVFELTNAELIRKVKVAGTMNAKYPMGYYGGNVLLSLREASRDEKDMLVMADLMREGPELHLSSKIEPPTALREGNESSTSSLNAIHLTQAGEIVGAITTREQVRVMLWTQTASTSVEPEPLASVVFPILLDEGDWMEVACTAAVVNNASAFLFVVVERYCGAVGPRAAQSVIRMLSTPSLGRCWEAKPFFGIVQIVRHIPLLGVIVGVGRNVIVALDASTGEVIRHDQSVYPWQAAITSHDTNPCIVLTFEKGEVRVITAKAFIARGLGEADVKGVVAAKPMTYAGNRFIQSAVGENCAVTIAGDWEGEGERFLSLISWRESSLSRT